MDGLALLLPSLLMVPAMGLLSRRRGSGLLDGELRRKALHVGIGLAALVFPALLREPATIVFALALVIAWLLAVRYVPALQQRFGCVLQGAGRLSWGEVWFAVSIALLLLASTGHPLLYVVPLLLLTLSDALAAIVGRAWPLGRLPGPLAGKTLSGSLAFLSSAFLVTATPRLAGSGIEPAAIVRIAFAVAILTTLAEALSGRGFDNLTVPATAWLTLFLVFNG